MGMFLIIFGPFIFGFLVGTWNGYRRYKRKVNKQMETIASVAMRDSNKILHGRG